METYAASVLTQVEIASHGEALLAYILVGLGTILFGNLVALPAILLGFKGVLGQNGWITIPASVLVGHLTGDVIWYTLGRSLANTRFGEWLRKRLPKHKRIDAFFESGSVYVLSVSKLLAASTAPILFLLGWYQTEPGKYARLSGISAAVWFASVIIFSFLLYSGLRIVF